MLGLGGSALGTVSGLGALAAAAAPVVLGVAAVGTATYFAIKAGKERSASHLCITLLVKKI
ncbi:hypothetical protein WP50_25685 [Lactiplantibacillus plantarum]|nr:hypothetical protein WP50_25685 [Lactiplantibacillus plantarum]